MMRSHLQKVLWLALLFSFPCLSFAQSSTPVAWPLWSAYTAHFLDTSGRIIDHDDADRTTSEGQAYAMFFALVANDRPHFDSLLAWTTDNLADGDLTAHLPAWKWGRAADGSWHILDKNSAADADLWMSYTLMEAGMLWREPRYRSLGVAMAALIVDREVKNLPGLGPVMLPASDGFSTADRTVLNPSYSPLPVLTGMASALPHGPWNDMAKSLPELIQRSSVAGFAMDWAAYNADTGFVPAVVPSAATGTMPAGSYDAIRVYLWAGIAPASMPGAMAILHALPGMQAYLDAHPVPPRIVDGHGVVTADDGSVGFSAALLPYLTAWNATETVAEQQNRLAALLNPKNGLYGSHSSYYDQNLALFGQGWQQQRYSFSSDGELQVPWSEATGRIVVAPMSPEKKK